jgi:SAM-dependent methyltransferase
VAVAWSLLSLLVSYYVYDRSELVAARWLPALLSQSRNGWATVHAGLDAELDLSSVLADRCLARLDIFEAALMTSSSIARARALTSVHEQTTACSARHLALEDESCANVIVAFTAHEIRDRAAREAFFDELRRALVPGGRAVIVEHVRDCANFLAFGLGYLHFAPRREWLRLGAHARLSVAAEVRVTPWVMALALERPR